MDIRLNYNDLQLLLTPENKQQIKDIPQPSHEQGKLMIKMRKDYYRSKEVPKTHEDVMTGIMSLKPYIKVFVTLPELFI